MSLAPCLLADPLVRPGTMAFCYHHAHCFACLAPALYLCLYDCLCVRDGRHRGRVCRRLPDKVCENHESDRRNEMRVEMKLTATTTATVPRRSLPLAFPLPEVLRILLELIPLPPRSLVLLPLVLDLLRPLLNRKLRALFLRQELRLRPPLVWLPR